MTVKAVLYPLNLTSSSRWLTEPKALEKFILTNATKASSSKHVVTNSSDTRGLSKLIGGGEIYTVTRSAIKPGSNELVSSPYE